MDQSVGGFFFSFVCFLSKNSDSLVFGGTFHLFPLQEQVFCFGRGRVSTQLGVFEALGNRLTAQVSGERRHNSSLALSHEI